MAPLSGVKEVTLKAAQFLPTGVGLRVTDMLTLLCCEINMTKKQEKETIKRLQGRFLEEGKEGGATEAPKPRGAVRERLRRSVHAITLACGIICRRSHCHYTTTSLASRG